MDPRRSHALTAVAGEPGTTIPAIAEASAGD
jgi:hypothetical protein